MARFDFTFTGDKNLAGQLAALPDKLEQRILAQAIRRATQQVIRPAIVAATPVRQVGIQERRGARGQRLRVTKRQIRTAQRLSLRFARLRNSYSVRALRRAKGRVGVALQAGTRQQLGIRGRGYYPAHLEFGFETRGSGRQVIPRKYMKSPLVRLKTVWLQTVAQGMRAGLEREVRP